MVVPKEKQLNIPVDASYHDRLKILAARDRMSMKQKIHNYIDIDDPKATPCPTTQNTA